MNKRTGVAVFFSALLAGLCGTEHSVADMYYWAVSGALVDVLGASFLRLVVISLGNVCGGLLLPGIEKCNKKLLA